MGEALREAGGAFRLEGGGTSAVSSGIVSPGMRASPVGLVAGPSHLVRWERLVRAGQLPAFPDDARLIGKPGTPVWSAPLLEAARGAVAPDRELVLLVGDFRFGNGAYAEGPRPDTLFAAAPAGIAQAAIKPAIDAEIMERSLRALDAWAGHFGRRIRFILWDLLCRQVMDRMAGRHIVDRRYRHPHWNLAEVQGRLAHLRLIDLEPLTRQPMHEVLRLIIDSSAHPSQAGFLFLDGVVFDGADPLAAYRQATSRVEDDLAEAARQAVARGGRPVVLSGRSAWLDTLMRCLGQPGAARLRGLGLHLAPLNAQIGHPPPQLPAGLADQLLVLVSANGPSDALAAGLDRLGIPRAAFERSMELPWEVRCAGTIRARGEQPAFAHLPPGESLREGPPWPDGLVELGPRGEPTFAGLLHLLGHIR
jgi:hypothetical protein